MNTIVHIPRQPAVAARIVSVVIGTITAQGVLLRRMGDIATVDAGGTHVTGRIITA